MDNILVLEAVNLSEEKYLEEMRGSIKEQIYVGKLKKKLKNEFLKDKNIKVVSNDDMADLLKGYTTMQKKKWLELTI